MFSPTTEQQFNTEIYRITQHASYMFWPFSAIIREAFTKKNKTLANYDSVLFFFFARYLPDDSWKMSKHVGGLVYDWTVVLKYCGVVGISIVQSPYCTEQE